MFFLVRHGEHELGPDVLAGRRDDVGLSEEGRRQVRRLAGRLAAEGITALQSSPRTRTRETADAIALAAGLPVEIIPAADEIDFGGWTGKSWGELESDPLWRRWNGARSTARPPGGESMGEASARISAHLGAMRRCHPEGRIAIVSHAEIIRAAVLDTLGLPLDVYQKLEVAPASVTTIIAGEWGAKLAGLNACEFQQQ